MFALCVASPASAGIWLGSVTLSAEGQSPQVDIDPEGNAIAVWQGREENLADGNRAIQASVKSIGGAWQTPVGISEAGHAAGNPQLAMDPMGNAVAVWENINETGMTIQAAMRPAGGAWQAPVTLSEEFREEQVNGVFALPKVAIDSQGEAIAVWSSDNGTRTIQAATKPAGGSWQTPVTIAAGSEPQLAVDSRGDAVVVWEGFGGKNTTVLAATRSAGGDWGPAVALSGEGLQAGNPHVAIDSQGEALATWWQRYSDSTSIYAASRPLEGVWQGPVDLSGIAAQANSSVAMDPEGDAFVAWEGLSPLGTPSGPLIVEGAVKPVGGPWQTPLYLSEIFEQGGVEEAFNPHIGADSQGNAYAIWERIDNGSTIIQAAVKPADSGWQLPLDLPSSEGGSQLAVDSQGHAAAVWISSVGVRADIYDPNTLPEVFVGDASALGQTSATLNATVNPLDSEVNGCYFEYGPSPAYGSRLPCATLPGSGMSPVAVSAAASGLSANTTYYFRVVATNATGSSYSSPQTFTTALPMLPEVGRCLILAHPAGRYTTSACTSKSTGEDTGKYEWQPWPAMKDRFSFENGPATLETVGKSLVKCTRSVLAGDYSGSQAVSVSLTLTGCEAPGVFGGRCQSEGASAGEIVSSALRGQIGFIQAGEKPSVGWDLTPVSGSSVAVFACGATDATLAGSVVAPITPIDKMSGTFTLQLKAKNGKQSLEQLEGGVKDTLTLSSQNAAEQVGLTAEDTISNEEPLEIRAIP